MKIIMNNNYISILMPIYNGIEFLKESLPTILYQTHKNWELIIGINGHSQNSEIFIEANKYKSDKIKINKLINKMSVKNIAEIFSKEVNVSKSVIYNYCLRIKNEK